ncbi:MAG: type II secretion system F family protein [Armatimonadetes bacterium]|nr:type II secretion system F family protein [Armatimonadota bacterium]
MPTADSQVSNADMAAFCRQFASLMHAQVNILDIFEALREQTGSALMREILDKVRSDVEMGRTLATAFSRYPQVFSPFFISMVRQGELEGELDRIMSDLAEHFETRLEDGVDARKMRDSGGFDLEAVASAFQWIYIWSAALLGFCALGSGLVYYATGPKALPGEPFANIAIFIGLVMFLGVLVFSFGRRRRRLSRTGS